MSEFELDTDFENIDQGLTNIPNKVRFAFDDKGVLLGVFDVGLENEMLTSLCESGYLKQGTKYSYNIYGDLIIYK